MTVEAQLDIQQRRGRQSRAHRRDIRLVASGERVSGAGFHALVHNISATGLLIESGAELAVGDVVTVSLPETGSAKAAVVWADAPFFGCAFEAPISDAAVSAAQLKSAPTPSGPEHEGEAASSAPGTMRGSDIRRLRMAQGLSLVEFAALMQVSRPTVWAWETGKSSPRKSKADRLARVLGLSTGSNTTASKAVEPRDAADARTGAHVDDLIAQLKAQVAAIAGTSPDKVKLIIEV